MSPTGPAARRAQERREAPRLPGRVEYLAEDGQGEGLVEDLSLKGLHVADATWLPAVESSVELSFCLGEQRIPARADVVRHTEAGFAARFTRLDVRLQRVLLAVGPAAASLKRGR